MMSVNATSVARFPGTRVLRALLVLVLALCGYLVASPRAAAQNVPVTTTNGNLPDGMVWRITMPTTGWNGTLLLDLDFTTANNRYIPLYNRGFAAAGIARIPFEQQGRDSRVSARQLMEVLDIFNSRFGRPPYVILNGESTGGVVSGYTLEHYSDKVDGAVASCTVPGYIPYLMPRFSGLWAAKHFFDIDLPIVQHPGGASLATDTAAWRAAIDAAQATPEGKARIALSLAVAQMNTWTSTALPAPDTSNLEQVQQYMHNTLRNLYSFDVDTFRNREQQVGGNAFVWTTGFDYKKIFEENIRPEHRATIVEFYQRAGLDLHKDLQDLNRAPRFAADPDAVAEIHARGDYSGNPGKPFLMNNLIGDPLVQTASNQGYLDLAKKNGNGDLVRLIHVAGAGHCGFRANERVAAIEVMNDRLRTGVWPSLSAADLNLRASTINPALVPRFTEYQDAPFAGGFWTGDVYNVLGCADPNSANAANGFNRASPDRCPARP